MEYTVLRSQRKTMSVSVKDGKVIVRAPMHTSAQNIEEFVNRHRVWIMRRVKEQEERHIPDFADGSFVEILGRERRIETGKTKLTADTLYLPLENREEVLIRLLKALSREYMTAITEELAAKYGFRYERIRITSAKTRWGSCNVRGTIAYSFRTAFLPEELMRYLAAHELCHTRHMDHSKAFWDLVEKIIPNCKAERRKLKSYLWAMKCL